MNYIEMNGLLQERSRAGTIHQLTPKIVGGRLIGFVEASDDHVLPFLGNHEEAQRLMRTYNFNVSLYWSRQLAKVARTVRAPHHQITDDFRHPRPSKPIDDAEVAQYKEQLAQLLPHHVLEISHTEPRQRVLTALRRAAFDLGITIHALPASKGKVLITREE